MASLTFPALILAAVFIFHTETADAKAMVANREKRAPNFFAYPRGGRAMNFFHWPRGGKRVDGLADDTCCSEGIITIYSTTGVKTYCKGSQCCEGLEKRYLEEAKDSLSVLCVPTEFNGAQEHATT